MNRNSPVPLWAVLSTGVVVLGSIYVFVRQPRASPRPSVSATPLPTPALPTPVSSPTSSPTGTAEPVPGEWKTYRNTKCAFQFDYPATWTDAGRDLGIQDYFTSSSETSVLDVELVNPAGSLAQTAAKDIQRHDCLAEDGVPLDHILETEERGVLYVLYCSATTEDYLYLFTNSFGNVLRLTYHDDFDESWSLERKLHTFDQIIASLKPYS